MFGGVVLHAYHRSGVWLTHPQAAHSIKAMGQVDGVTVLETADVAAVVVPSLSASQKPCIVWWRTLLGRAVVIIAASDGRIAFVDVARKQQVAWHPPPGPGVAPLADRAVPLYPQVCTLLVSPLVRSISSLRLFEDVQFGTIVRYLLVHTADGRFWRLVLERQETRRDVLPSDGGVRDAASVDGSVAQSSVRSGHAVHAVGGMSLGALNLSTRSALAGRRSGKGDAGAALPSMMEGQAATGDGQLPAGYRSVLDSRLTGSAGVVVGVGSTGTTALPAISPDALGPEFKYVQLCVALRAVCTSALTVTQPQARVSVTIPSKLHHLRPSHAPGPGVGCLRPCHRSAAAVQPVVRTPLPVRLPAVPGRLPHPVHHALHVCGVQQCALSRTVR